MYAFVYVDTQTIPMEEHFPDTKTFFVSYKDVSNPVPFPKHWMVLSYIHSEAYELDQNFDDT